MSHNAFQQRSNPSQTEGVQRRAGTRALRVASILAILLATGLLLTLGLGAAPRPRIETGSPAPDPSSPAYLVRDIYTGTESSAPANLTAVGDLLLFVADDGLHGRELWASDGTTAGTYLVRDIAPEPVRAYLSALIDLEGTLLFRAYNGDDSGLWRSDGTQAGTVRVKGVTPGYGYLYGKKQAVIDGTLYFDGHDNEQRYDYELWRSDGTTEGTTLVKDIHPGTDGSYPGQLTVVDGVFFFQASDGTHGKELWVSDGTAEGTRLVKDITPGAESSFQGMFYSQMAGLNGLLLFRVGSSLWKSDGTPEGTNQVAAVSGYRFTAVGNTLFFLGSADDSDWELWKTDGTAAGTVLVKDIHPTGSSCPGDLTALNGLLVFKAEDDTHGRELWKSDGTPGGTTLVKEIDPGLDCRGPQATPEVPSAPCYSREGEMTVYQGLLVLNACHDLYARELWVSDGTPSGTVMLQEINSLEICNSHGGRPGTGSYPCESDPRNWRAVNGTLYFSADDGVHGRELWALRSTRTFYLPLVQQP